MQKTIYIGVLLLIPAILFWLGWWSEGLLTVVYVFIVAPLSVVIAVK